MVERDGVLASSCRFYTLPAPRGSPAPEFPWSGGGALLAHPGPVISANNLMRIAGLMGLVLLAGCGWMKGRPGPSIVPPQDVDMDAEALGKFQHEIVEYVDLHRELLERIPRVTEKSTPEEIAAHRKKMTDGIRAERQHAKQGEIFKPKVATAFRGLLHRQLTGPGGADMLKEIRAGNPRVEGTPRPQDPTRETTRPITVAVNAVYPEDAPLSSVPSSLLLHMPVLPEQVKYGFVGRELILRDTEANVILDFIPDAVPDATLPR